MTFQWVAKALQRYHMTHLHHLMQYGSFVESHGIYFDSPILLNQNFDYVGRSFFHLILPSWLMAIFGLRALIVILWHDHLQTKYIRLVLFCEVLPPNGRANIELTLLIWSLLHLLYCYYVIQTRSTDFTMVAVLVVSPRGAIKPRHLDLSQWEYETFAGERRKYITILNLTIYMMSTFSTITFLIQAHLGNLFALNTGFVLFWLIYFFLWCTYACSAAYGIPAYVSIVSQYICIKQRRICAELVRQERRLDCLNARLQHSTEHSVTLKRVIHRCMVASIYREVIKQNQRYLRVMRETRHYGTLISRCLNVTCSTYIFIIAYVTHLLFISSATLDWYLVYVNVYLLHIMLLSALILSCAKLCHTNSLVSHRMMRIFNRCFVSHLFTCEQLIQLEALTRSLQVSKFGFSLSNGYLVKRKGFILIIAYILRIFRRHRITPRTVT